MPKAFVFYRGPSQLDGAPIVAIATLDSRNRANGAMVQTWIMRADMHPAEALHTGDNASVCGGCPHQGIYSETRKEWLKARTCYVLIPAFAGIWKAWYRGSYDDLSDNLPAASARVAGRQVRLGAYGDPAAVPIGVWHALLAQSAPGHTGYTHQWRAFPEFAELCMASVDSLAERVHARALGFRTFRVAALDGWTRESGEVLCAKSAEAGHKTTCDACKACGGTSSRARADIMIPAHGTAQRFVH